MKKNKTRDLILMAVVFFVIWGINQKAVQAAPSPTIPTPIPIPPGNQNPLSYQDDYNSYLDH